MLNENLIHFKNICDRRTICGKVYVTELNNYFFGYFNFFLPKINHRRQARIINYRTITSKNISAGNIAN